MHVEFERKDCFKLQLTREAKHSRNGKCNSENLQKNRAPLVTHKNQMSLAIIFSFISVKPSFPLNLFVWFLGNHNKISTYGKNIFLTLLQILQDRLEMVLGISNGCNQISTESFNNMNKNYSTSGQTLPVLGNMTHKNIHLNHHKGLLIKENIQQ